MYASSSSKVELAAASVHSVWYDIVACQRLVLLLNSNLYVVCNHHSRWSSDRSIIAKAFSHSVMLSIVMRPTLYETTLQVELRQYVCHLSDQCLELTQQVALSQRDRAMLASLNISLSHSLSLNVIQKDTPEKGVSTYKYFIVRVFTSVSRTVYEIFSVK